MAFMRIISHFMEVHETTHEVMDIWKWKSFASLNEALLSFHSLIIFLISLFRERDISVVDEII